MATTPRSAQINAMAALERALESMDLAGLRYAKDRILTMLAEREPTAPHAKLPIDPTRG